jgi:hypothetical protein
MRKLVIGAALLVALANPFFSEDSTDDTVYMPISLQVVLVGYNSLGYIVIYQKNSTEMDKLYVPIEWLRPDENGHIRAAIVTGHGKEYPAITLFFNGKEFSHLKLYLPKDSGHPDIFYAPITEELKKQFSSTTTITIGE